MTRDETSNAALADRLVARPLRVCVLGSSGSGKSTFARRLGVAAGAPHVELDAVNWQPNWVELNKSDPDEFLRRVGAMTAGPSWVTDGNYRRDVLAPRATHLVWLDYPRSVIMPRVIRRSFLRALEGKELWAGTGNRETFSRWFGKGHPIRYAWSTYDRRRAQYEEMFADPALAGVEKHRLRHPREAAPLIARLVAQSLEARP